MFSDVVGAFRALLSLPPGAFVLFFWVLGKIFRSLVLGGHWVILAVVALGVYGFAGQFFREGQYVLDIMAGVPLLFLGREVYRRLVNG